MKKTHALFILAAGVLLAAEPKPADSVKKEKEKLVGKWDVVSHEMDGQKLPKEITKTMGATFTATMLTTKLGGKDETPSSYTLDPSKDPKHLDIISNATEKGKEDIVPAIYVLDGDTLEVCFPAEFKGGKKAPRKRPAKFDGSEGTGQAVMSFKRVKP